MVRGIRLTGLLLAMASLSDPTGGAQPSRSEPIIIAHRGASGERPEHTLAAYERAIDQGADYIEPDLVPTKDGVLVARHENEISGTTDVASRPEFAARKATKVIDGESVTGWFTEDFTLAELRSLRARERLPELRRANTRFDGLYPVPTFAEVIALVRAKEAETGRRIGLYPEIKHPAYFTALGQDLPALLVAELERHGLNNAQALVYIQCFEAGPLERLNNMTPLPLVQLIAASGGPADRPALTYAPMLTPDGLARLATHVDAIGTEVPLVIAADGRPTGLIERAHAAGLKVHAWTLRRENQFLPPAFRQGSDPAAPGQIGRTWALLRAAGVDGVFTDNPGDIIARQ
ncbi:MAG: glycerophosphodiester phosphodiesterase [Novosphingobium sp.]